MKRHSWLNVKGNLCSFWKNTFEFMLKKLDFNLIEIQNAVPLIFYCFLTHPKQWTIPEKIDEFNPVFPLQKTEKAWFYKTMGSVWL